MLWWPDQVWNSSSRSYSHPIAVSIQIVTISFHFIACWSQSLTREAWSPNLEVPSRPTLLFRSVFSELTSTSQRTSLSISRVYRTVPSRVFLTSSYRSIEIFYQWLSWLGRQPMWYLNRRMWPLRSWWYGVNKKFPHPASFRECYRVCHVHCSVWSRVNLFARHPPSKCLLMKHAMFEQQQLHKYTRFKCRFCFYVYCVTTSMTISHFTPGLYHFSIVPKLLTYSTAHLRVSIVYSYSMLIYIQSP